MEKIKLNKDMGKISESSDYKLSPLIEYEINLQNEFEEQQSILTAFGMMGSFDMLRDWFLWLNKSGFSESQPNPTNKIVGKYYGKEPLWKTELSQGIVVKSEEDNDYYIVMECSRENEGFKHTQMILTMGGCY